MQRVVVVSGGFGTLGRAVGNAFAADGWSVALLDRAPAPDASTQDRQWLLGDVDLTDLGSARKAMLSVVERVGPLNALINVAGGFRWETLADSNLETWDVMYQMNVRTAVTASRAALEHFANGAEGARIVNVGAGAALRASTGMGAYAASKAGVLRFTEALADEVKDRGMTVNAVLPGVIDTPQNRKDMPDADFSRWVQPADIAAVILFLTTPCASAVTGASIPIAGRL
ncbi:NAD(P)-dependent dehydrogenase (short-subunit alcohol dehydrogenase family) [Paraburkholderia sp. BL6665CI2N2]|uniref:SDR family NAD(P)-dependent oxidoreductase n=1 Tax=Paraburkholderia sp. BL6665CI2N2 TaxID=1938806 RepID=UPI0010650BD4|nr:SDR family NAD(P)-dependent oxidoreductase [Paraburkholderia sp. BL6665CI2N2]TDY26986.1 NAD(P)-dependent dehydrogenase (short-subunit alcohol dehydrogenase family) [Paraburkholderia sp. BL6665CI2N2]